MINLNSYKKKYFSDKIFTSSNDLLDHFRNFGIKNNLTINEEDIKYKDYDAIDLLNILSDKVFFYKVKSSSIKNMLYQNKLFYQVFDKESQIESYLYRIINENRNNL